MLLLCGIGVFYKQEGVVGKSALEKYYIVCKIQNDFSKGLMLVEDYCL